MIRRAPRPDHGFLLLRNDVARDSRLSYRARGILMDILSRPDNWTASAEALARACPGGEGVKAIRTALRELEAAGYLKRERIRIDGGRFAWKQSVYDLPQGDISAGGTVSPKPPDGFPPDGNRPSKEEPTRTTEEEDGTDKDCPTSGRSAPSGGAHTEILTNVDDEGPPEPDIAAEGPQFNDWRSEDRASFLTVVGDALVSDGSKWKPQGRYESIVFYNAFRKSRAKRLRWPGRFVNELYARGAETAVEDWLMDQGLEVA